MNPTNTEKLIIAMLCDVMKKLGNSTGLDPIFIQESIRLGNEWAIEWKYSHIFASSDDETPSEVIEVFCILNMYSNLKSSFEALSDCERHNLTSEALISNEGPFFPGFDSINETKHASLATFLVKDMNFSDSTRLTLQTSHHPMLARYRRQYAEYERVLAEMQTEDTLDKDRLLRILTA